MSKRKRQNPKNQGLSGQKTRRRSGRREGGGKPTNSQWLYGFHAVRAALLNPDRTCLELLATRNAMQSLPERSGLACTLASANDIERSLPDGAVHQGAALRVEALPDRELQDLGNVSGPLVVLDQVTDAQNVGAILRSCAAFGASALIQQQRHSPPVGGVLAKAASGALERVPLIRVTNLARCLDELGENGHFRIGLAEEANHLLSEAQITAPTTLVLGAEGGGLRRLTREKCDLLVRLPTDPSLPSLNVSNAAAVALYELTSRKPRQD